jgi:uncharacterized protein with PQ loop repeat
VRTCSAILILVFYFLAPLSTLWQVIRQRDSSSLVLPLSVMVIINGSLWSTYGIVALNDPFVWAPNVFGATLGVVQVFLKLTIPSNPNQYAPLPSMYLKYCFSPAFQCMQCCFSPVSQCMQHCFLHSCKTELPCCNQELAMDPNRN